jgi:hypothetical protein
VSQQVEYRWYQEGDEEQIIELLEDVFNGWPKFNLKCTKAEHWIWKFKDNPLKRNIVCLAEHNKRIIGFTGSINLQYRIGSKTYLGLADYDNAVHKDYQGRGIYSSLWDFWSTHPDSELSRVEISTTSNPKVIKKFLKSGALPFPKKISIFTKILDFRKAIKKPGIQGKINYLIGLAVLSPINKLSNRSKRRKKTQNHSIIEIDKFTDEITPFIEKIYQKYDFIFERPVDYLNWRYCDIRGGDYKIWIARINGKIVGYIVCRVNSFGELLDGNIVDLLVDPDHKKAAFDLCNVGLKYFEDSDVCKITTWMIKDHWLDNVLSSFGFFNTRWEVGVFYDKDLDNSDGEAFITATSSRLHLQMGDTDAI